jgi:predicted permease
MALRMSLGAGRLRLVHQLLTESALLVTLAGGAALLLARWTSDLLVRTATASGNGLLPFAASVDLRVLGVTAAIALTSVVLFAVLPAWRTTRLDLIAVLKGARGASGGSGARPARLLVIVQVALSLVLVTATGLLVRSFQNLLNVDVGFTREHLLSVAIDPRLSATSPGAMAALHQRILNNVASVPGVSSASLAMCGLLSNCRAREDGFRIEGYQAQPDEQVVFLVNAVSPNYSSTVGMRLVAGRPLNDGDRMDTPQVAVVNQTLASRYFEAGHAIGRRFGNPTPNIEIVGIVEDARVLNVRDPVVPTAFFSLNQRPIAARSLDVRVAGDPLQAIPGVRAALRQAAPDLTIERAQTIDERIDINLTQERLIMFLASGFGMVALGLAGLGLFGVLSYAVARRTSEFGIRMTLGASQSTVAWSVAREALALVMCGFALGLPFVFVGGRLASTLFFGVGPNDWSTLLASTLVLVAVGAVCSAVPALRASRVDPIVALRAE